jgi:hypothetical protein
MDVHEARHEEEPSRVHCRVGGPRTGRTDEHDRIAGEDDVDIAALDV